jgi:hypothetical protein
MQAPRMPTTTNAVDGILAPAMTHGIQAKLSRYPRRSNTAPRHRSRAASGPILGAQNSTYRSAFDNTVYDFACVNE